MTGQDPTCPTQTAMPCLDEQRRDVACPAETDVPCQVQPRRDIPRLPKRAMPRLAQPWLPNQDAQNRNATRRDLPRLPSSAKPRLDETRLAATARPNPAELKPAELKPAEPNRNCQTPPSQAMPTAPCPDCRDSRRLDIRLDSVEETAQMAIPTKQLPPLAFRVTEKHLREERRRGDLVEWLVDDSPFAAHSVEEA